MVVAAASVAATVVLVALFDRPAMAVADAAGAGLVAGMATVAVSASVSRITRRSWGAAPPTWGWVAGSGAGIVLGILAALGLAEPGVTVFGLPMPAAGAALGHALSRTLFVSVHGSVPVAPSPALVLGTALGAVVVVVAGQALWYASGRILAALAPSALALLACSWVARGDGAVPLVLVWAAAALAAVLVSGGRRQPLLAVGMLVASVGVGAAMAVVPVSGSGLFPTAPGSPASGSVLVVRHPSADILPEKITLSHVTVMTVRSPVPSYWQLTTLNQFTGAQWLPGTPARPPPSLRRRLRGVTEVTQSVHLLALDSSWLPAAPEPQSVHGAPGAVVTAADGSVVDPADPSRYTVVSAVPSDSASKLAALPAVGAQRWLAPDLQMVRQPAVVTRLAHRLVAGISGPYRQALALVGFFDSGRFRYTLTPPAGPGGVDPLVAFLTDTRAGYCQQFASAFAVLARIDGLPTRLGVGFATGTRTSADTYKVLGSDAHVWPEVYLGASVGWVAFEPTPAASEAAVPVGGVHRLLPTSAARSSARPVGVQGLGDLSAGLGRLPVRSTIRPAGGVVTVPAARIPAHHGAGAGLWAAVAAGLALVLMLVVTWWVRRHRRGSTSPALSGKPARTADGGRRRWWVSGATGVVVGVVSRHWHLLPVVLARRWPDTAEQRIEASWARTTRVLRRHHGVPLPHETAVGYVARITGSGARAGPVEGPIAQPSSSYEAVTRRGRQQISTLDVAVLAQLAELVSTARFGPLGSDEVVAKRVEGLADQIGAEHRRALVAPLRR